MIHRPRLLGLLLALAVLAGVLLLTRHPQAPATAPSLPEHAWTLPDGAVVSGSPGPAAPPAESIAAAENSPEEPDLGPACGYGRWLGDSVAPDEAAKARVDRQLGLAWMKGLQQSAQPLDQAIGWWLASTAFNVVEPRLADCRGESCLKAVQRLQGRMERVAGRREEGAQALLALAWASNDPRVLALGLSQCEWVAQPLECRSSLAARWTALEPDNAAAWLEQARIARETGDAAGEISAIHQAAQAPRHQPTSAWLVHRLVSSVPDEWQGELRLHLQVQALGGVYAMQDPVIAAVEHCRGVNPDEANRQLVCDRLAEGLLRRAHNLQTLGLVTVLGRQAGWPEDRTTRLRAEHDRLLAASTDFHTEAAPGSVEFCRQAQRGSAWIQRSARLGELAFLRSLVDRR